VAPLTRRELLASAAFGAAALAGGARAATPRLRRYEYVLPDGAIYVYDRDRGFALVRKIDLPQTARGTRGVCGSALTGMLYVSYGGIGGEFGNGALLRLDLVRSAVVWARDYPFGIDSMSISPDGRRIYMPDGSESPDGIVRVLDAGTGAVVGRIQAESGPHNTLLSRDGRRLYIGCEHWDYLLVADTKTRRVVKSMGRFVGGIRPFTINGSETLAFVNCTGFLGFQVASITTGRVLYTVPFEGFSFDPKTYLPSAPSHGISLAPAERKLYVVDAPNDYVHVYDVSSLPRSAPKLAGSIKVSSFAEPETGCAYSCLKDGWLSQTRDGRYLFVGDAGDVIDTAAGKVVAQLDPLANTRKFIEVEFDAHGRVAWVAPFRSSVGQVVRAPR
jgi:DNA-binding beta-propeller fold protein YncE